MCTVGLFFVTQGEYIQKKMLKEKDRTWLYLAGSVDAPCSMNMYLLFPLSHFKFISQLRGCQAEPEMQMFMVKTRLSRGPPTKQSRCNPDVAPRTSGGYEDKVDVITPINIALRGGTF